MFSFPYSMGYVRWGLDRSVGEENKGKKDGKRKNVMK